MLHRLAFGKNDLQPFPLHVWHCELTTASLCSGEILASAGDDGNVILWVPSDLPPSNFGADAQDDKESWRAKHMCRSSGAEIYDLAWSPDAAHFIIGSMDNIARIYNANSGKPARPFFKHCYRQVASPLNTETNQQERLLGKLLSTAITSRV